MSAKLGERVLRAWKDYDVCPDFEQQMEALINCVTALEKAKTHLPANPVIAGKIVDFALVNLEKVLPGPG